MIIYYHPRTIRFLQKIDTKTRNNVLEKVKKISIPFLKELDIKKLTTTKRSYRLRIRNVRVIFEILQKSIYIHDINFRGNVY